MVHEPTYTTGLSHVDGAVLGKVTKGMSVVRKILRLPTSKDARNPALQGQMLVELVQIIAARRAT